MWLLAIILPLFIIGLRFWTAPAYLVYTGKENGLAAPLSILPVFFSTHIDIMCLGILVFCINFYAFWYHIDPMQTTYAGGRYTTRRPLRHGDSSSSDDDVQYDY